MKRALAEYVQRRSCIGYLRKFDRRVEPLKHSAEPEAALHISRLAEIEMSCRSSVLGRSGHRRIRRRASLVPFGAAQVYDAFVATRFHSGTRSLLALHI